VFVELLLYIEHAPIIDMHSHAYKVADFGVGLGPSPSSCSTLGKLGSCAPGHDSHGDFIYRPIAELRAPLARGNIAVFAEIAPILGRRGQRRIFGYAEVLICDTAADPTEHVWTV
jgi:hypothetical protein